MCDGGRSLRRAQHRRDGRRGGRCFVWDATTLVCVHTTCANGAVLDVLFADETGDIAVLTAASLFLFDTNGGEIARGVHPVAGAVRRVRRWGGGLDERGAPAGAAVFDDVDGVECVECLACKTHNNTSLCLSCSTGDILTN